MNVNNLLQRAKKDKRKGNMEVYEQYKNELIGLKPTREQYDSTLRLLVIALKI